MILNTLIVNSIRERVTKNAGADNIDPNNRNDGGDLDTVVVLQTGIITESPSKLTEDTYILYFNENDNVLKIDTYIPISISGNTLNSINRKLKIKDLVRIYNTESVNPVSILSIDHNNFIVTINKMAETQYELQLVGEYREADLQMLLNYKGSYSLYIDDVTWLVGNY